MARLPASARRAMTSVLLALPAALLALGWLLASWREDAARREQERRALAASADVVAAAVREGLEELRAREDERPYYLYSYYYTPPDLIAVQESVATSPLGRLPTDPRVRGHFQVDPGAAIASPLLHAEAPAASRARGAEVVALLRSPAGVRLTTLARGAPAPPRVGAVESGLAARNMVNAQSAYSGAVLADIRAAQAGEAGAYQRVERRGRAPERSRVTLGGAEGAAGAESGEAPAARGGELALYTRMAIHRDGDAAFLYRVVTTDGASSVQGAVLDLAVLRGRWVDAVVSRHARPGIALAVVPATRADGCAARASLAAPLDDRAVCARAAVASSSRAFAWQLLALSGVLALVVASSAARARALRRAETLAAVERAFVASVSHELRTPLTTLRMHAEMLHEGWVAEERRPRVIQQLVDESARLARLVDDVLTFGRLADGRSELALADGDVGAAVRAIVEREHGRLEDRGARLAVRVEGDGPVRARFDPTALDQVVTNLLDNAAKYAAGASDRAIEVTVARAAAGGAVVRVRDHGPGIPRAEREKVFDRFYRSRDAIASHVAGTGLGLAIVRGLARAMGGDARVVDTPDGDAGCAIELTVPAPSDPRAA